EVHELIKNLKNIGVIFFSKKENTVFIADEMVRLLRRLRKKEVSDKFFRRTLKLMGAGTINQIARIHNIEYKLTYAEKIEAIIKEGVSFIDVLSNEMFKENTTLTQRKKELNELCENKLNIKNLRGNTLEEKINSLINYFEEVEDEEKIGISLEGFEKLLVDLHSTLPKLNNQIKKQFELQEEFILNAEFLLN